jgi:predicted small metal-binding protein
MRVIDCECGAIVQAANDEELVGRVRAHVEEEHPDMALDDEGLKDLVSERAYTATDA